MAHPRSPQRLIEDQVRSWSLNNDPTAPLEPHRPVVALSRAFGAQGAAIGRRLGERTGFTVWDRTLVRAIADEAGADERLMLTLDERRRNAIDDTVRGFMRGVDATNVQYFRALIRVLRTIGAHGSAVVVGRGANHVYSDERALRVRVTAPLAWRMREYAARNGCSETIARDRTRQSDAERSDFVSHYFHADINDPADYDLVLNAAAFNEEELVELVISAYKQRFGITIERASG